MQKNIEKDSHTDLSEAPKASEDITLDEVRAFIAAHDWTFAKSMPTIPHFYVVRKNCRDDAEFARVVDFMRRHGEKRPWGKNKPLTYFDLDGYTYWTMGNPIPETTIINRKVEGTSMSPAPRK